MESPFIPKKLEDWNVDVLNELIKLRDIESETFDFKGTDLKNLYQHICAMANTRGGFLVLGVDENKTNSTILGFKKVGFRKGKENYVNLEIRNNIVNVEPTPQVDTKLVYDSNKFYVVMKIENNVFKKPYFIKNQGQCYVRIRDSSTPASRSTVLELFANLKQKLHDIENLHASAILLKEALANSLSYFRAISSSSSAKVAPVDLSLMRNAVLSCESFLSENNLLGWTKPNSSHEGITTILHTLETLNVYIKGYNMSDDIKTKTELQANVNLHGSYTLSSNLQRVPTFLDTIIKTADNFLSTYKNAE